MNKLIPLKKCSFSFSKYSIIGFNSYLVYSIAYLSTAQSLPDLKKLVRYSSASSMLLGGSVLPIFPSLNLSVYLGLPVHGSFMFMPHIVNPCSLEQVQASTSFLYAILICCSSLSEVKVDVPSFKSTNDPFSFPKRRFSTVIIHFSASFS